MKKTNALLICSKTKFNTDLIQLLHGVPIRVDQAEHWEDAETRLRSSAEPPHLIILACVGTGVDGLLVCQEIRSHYAGLLLVVSENADEHFHLLALELGAEVSLPVSAGAPLVAAHAKALLRRFGPASQPAVLTFGSLTVDANRRDAFISDQAAHLSTIEFQLIWYLARKPGCVVTRDEIYRELHSAAYNGYDRRIDVYMSRIRHKIGDNPSSPSYLKTVRGIGYQLMAE